MKKIYLILFEHLREPKYLGILLGIIGIHLFLLFNLRFTAWPEMLSYAFLRNHGFLLYKDMIYPYPPLLTMILSSLYAIFGYKLEVLKIMTWAIILANDILIFAIVKKLTKSYKLSAISLLFYVSTQPFLGGNQLWFDLAIVPPLLFATNSLLQKHTPRNLMIAGFAVGIATLIKQTSALFIVLSSLFVLFKYQDFKKLIYFLIGPTVLFLVLILRLITENTLGGFVNWVFIYPLTYWNKFPGYVQMQISSSQWRILALLLAPFALFLFRFRRTILKNKNLLVVTCYLLLSFVLIYPRFSFFHFQLSLAFLAVIFGYLLSKLRISPLFLIPYSLFLVYFIVRPSMVSDWGKETRFWGKSEMLLANEISQNVASDQKVYFLGLQSGLYVMSGRLPPKPWTDNFGWYLEIPGVQEQIIAGFEKDPPTKIFMTQPSSGNWYDLSVYRPKKLVDYIKQNYVLVGEPIRGVELWKRNL